MDIGHNLQTSEEYSVDQICKFITNEPVSNNKWENKESDKKENDVVTKSF